MLRSTGGIIPVNPRLAISSRSILACMHGYQSTTKCIRHVVAMRPQLHRSSRMLHRFECVRLQGVETGEKEWNGVCGGGRGGDHGEYDRCFQGTRDQLLGSDWKMEAE